MITLSPPPEATKRTLNQLRARRSGLGPSPGSSRRDNQRRADGTWAITDSAPAPSAPPIAIGSRRTPAKWR